MQASRVQSALLSLFKIIVAVLIVVLLLVPAKIQRKEFNGITDGEVSLSGTHHFCRRPDERAIAVKSSDVSAALGLPNGSEILTDDLLEYGQCRAKALKQKTEDLNVCLCARRWSFVCMIVFGFVCAVLNFVHIPFSPRSPDVWCAVCKFFESFVWVSLATAAIVWHVLDTGYFAPVGSSSGQAYFKVSIQWASACAFSYLYAVLSVLDGIAYYGFQTTPVDAKRAEPAVEQTAHRTAPAAEDPSMIALNELDKKLVTKLMDIRRVVEPRYTVVTIYCKTWP